MGDLVLKGATSGQITLTPTAIAGTNTLTVPAKTGNLITSADTGTVTNAMLATNAITSAILPAGSVLQLVNASTTAYASGTTTIPLDDTIPQNTEGTEFLTATITPKSATSKLFITFNGTVVSSVATWINAALFQDSTANALAAVTAYNGANTGGVLMPLTYYMTSGTTSATTFKIRIGAYSAATVYINGNSGARNFGGVSSTTLTITEIAA